MTPFACSVHTHATCCDGKSTLAEMVVAAYAAGVKYYGVSCHSHTPIDLDVGYVLPADMTAYRQSVLNLREEYAGRMEILLGLEWDSQSDVTPEGFDYWIGSVHYQAGNGRFYAADWGEEHFTACRDELFGGDALVVEVVKDGPACHTGAESCFFNEIYLSEELKQFSYEGLYHLIEGRKTSPKEGSYTTYLFEKGLDKILKKVGEECTEVIIGARKEDREETIFEIADLTYHVMVLMVQMGISVEDITRELEKRHVVDHKVKQERMQ